MGVKFYTYPSCSTCRNAKKWLEENDIEFEQIHLINETPSAADIKAMMEIGDVEPKQFFNSRGKKYRDLNLKDQIDDMDIDKMVTLLASDGMLIKRPIVTDGTKVTVGFKEDIYNEKWLQK